MEAVYLDYAATTPVREEVLSAMAPHAADRFGNPSSLHRWGREASAALEAARASVAHSLGARPREIHFVRGGTESDNLAILGACRALCETGLRPKLLVSTVEHPAVLEAAEHVAETGMGQMATIPVSRDGSVPMEAIRNHLSSGPGVISAMWVNNETGMILPIAEIADVARSVDAIMHTDASQAVGKVPVDVSTVPVSLLTATGHKIYGPKGTGVLFVRDGVRVSPLLHGGGQERSIRPGTEDVAGAVGFATALRLAVESQAAEASRLLALRTALEASLMEAIAGARVNAFTADRASHVSSMGFANMPDAQTLLMALDLEGIAVSGGSACASGSDKGSHVMAALYGEEDEYVSVRYSFGMGTSAEDVRAAVAATIAVVERVRAA